MACSFIVQQIGSRSSTIVVSIFVLMKRYYSISATVFAVANLAAAEEEPEARLAAFHGEMEPVLKRVCVGCHGPDKQKGKFRLDTLDPDLVTGNDTSWWLEVFDVISNGEMPPEDADEPLLDIEKSQLVDWLAGELQRASQVRRSEQGHTSFRRMTRYEYRYALLH